MSTQIIEIPETQWTIPETKQEWIEGVEAGKVLYFPHLPFQLLPEEERLLTPDIRDPNVRNISLNEHGELKGAVGDEKTLALVNHMVARFRQQAQDLIYSLLPEYRGKLRLAPTSYRPTEVSTRAQSWRADDKRMHVDAFPSRPNHGERILRVFSNINPEGKPRVWRVGEPFEDVVNKFLPKIKHYSPLQAYLMQKLRITKSYRSEYDHIMLQLHDGMKGDTTYQKEVDQVTMPFAAGSVWVCFSDQASHSVMSGQYMMEQTFHLSPDQQYYPEHSPLAILEKIKQKTLVNKD